jgi:ring-1,2-phenylacetyl-CoA epoxidase subunit PaaC
MQASISIDLTPRVQYLLRIGDTCLILGQRIAEWSGHAPILEEDIAMSNMALDLIGHARAVLTHAGQLEGRGHDEDRLAFLRDEKDYRNLTLAELPRGDFAFTVVRNTMLATLMKLLWGRLRESSDAELAGIAGKAVKEARYHQQHAADWMVRLGDGSDESRRRIERALAELWLYVPELFESDAVDEAAAADGLGPRWSELQAPWLAEMRTILDQARLTEPKESAFRSTGKRGVHTEHMGYILAEMQHLQRSFPGGVW